MADVGMAGGVLGKRVLDQTVTLIFGHGNLRPGQCYLSRRKEKAMAKYWINDEEKTKLFSKYMVNDKHYGMWAIQIMDGKHEFHVVTAKGRVLGSKMCTPKGPVYSLFDGENVDLVQVDPRLVFDDLYDLEAWEKGNLLPPAGRDVGLREFQLYITEYSKNKGDVYCCSAKKSRNTKVVVTGKCF